MTAARAEPLFVDTGAFFARFYERATQHARAVEVFEAIRDGELMYRPLYTSRYVLAELVAGLVTKATHAAALQALRTIREGQSFTVLEDTEERFETACANFEQYDDQEITLVDHHNAVLADEHDVEHVFTFDGDFRTLGLTVVPEDVDFS